MFEKQDSPFSQYWAMVHRRAAQEMDKQNFGSEMEAQSGGSSATFRASDSPEYVSKIMAESPVSFIARYPQTVDEMRANLGLGELETSAAMQINDATNSGGSAIANGTSGSSGGSWLGLPSLYDFNAWLAEKEISIAAFFVAIVLILGGLIIVALSTDTGKSLAKTGVEVAAA